MSPLTQVTAPAVAIPVANIDTDQLIPARFMKEPRRPAGYGRFLLHDGRDGAAAVLDTPAAKGAQILVAGRNFGCGSSREAAVYALVDAGFRVVLAPSFGDIFANNAANNGLLAGTMPTDAVERLLAGLADPADGPGAPRVLTVDLDRCTVTAPDGGAPLAFAVDAVVRTKLLNGWDDIDLTASYRDRIAAFAAADAARRPWARPAATG